MPALCRASRQMTSGTFLLSPPSLYSDEAGQANQGPVRRRTEVQFGDEVRGDHRVQVGSGMVIEAGLPQTGPTSRIPSGGSVPR